MKTMITLGAMLLAAGCAPVPVSMPNHSDIALTDLLPSHRNYPQAPPMIEQPQAIHSAPVVMTAGYRNTARVPSATSSAVASIPEISLNPPVRNGNQPASASTVKNLEWLAKRIQHNQQNDGQTLVSWDERENLAVLGIGKFTWYPANKSGRFSETFPAFLNYAKAHNANIPQWIAKRPSRGGPWANTAAFKRAKNDPQLHELKAFMEQSLNLQANFMDLKLQHVISKMLQQLPPSEQQKVQKNYLSVRNTPGGLYPLLDYLHFKGDGLNPKERYNGTGWGLQQVLQDMDNVAPGPAALSEFMRAADSVLMQRIANAPTRYREARMLSDWQKRVNTYRPQRTASR